ncbi:MAG: capsule assembly Wzi family protein [Dysgonomonas sp.]
MISKKHILIFVSIFFASCLITKAQDTDTEPLKNEGLDIKLETSGTFTSGDYAPFWLTNNNYGIGSEKDNNGYLRVNTKGYKKLFNDKLNVSLGVDIIGSHNLQTDFYFHQWYVDLRYRSLGLSAGAKERNNPFKNKDLSTGGLTLSNNARPIPQIEVGFPDFVPIPLTNDWLHIQGGISYGWFLDDKYKKHHAKDGNYAQDALYHRKYMYLKVEKKFSFQFYIRARNGHSMGRRIF